MLSQAIERMRETLRHELDLLRDLKKSSREMAIERQAAVVANQAKSDFLASMSHKIRTPMIAIIGMANLALDGDLGPRERRQIGKVVASAHVLLAIITDILDYYSKVKAGKLAVEHVDFTLGSGIESVVDMIGEPADR